jgi:hypothetical protein
MFEEVDELYSNEDWNNRDFSENTGFSVVLNNIFTRFHNRFSMGFLHRESILMSDFGSQP